ncbi:unnamed protein product [Moneuplotes crassus]|uniref:Uncharacterized protein n=1 Tax=Euplotes crassus TaxID=5936 RepID=A0AAD1XTY7_EUPCR|nr:unnamed protein product [Moneuplotes crassus]
MGCGNTTSTGTKDGVTEKARVTFVLGGPGCGKGTQCSLMVERDDFVHLSAGDLLREEQATDSKDSKLIKDYIKEGKIVPVEITCNLILKAMQKKGMSKKFLIDGFPRNEDNLQGWNKVMNKHANVVQVVFFELSEDIMLERIMKRAETSGRADDNKEAAEKRFNTFKNETMKVIKHFEGKKMVHKVDATGGIEDVYENLKDGLIV